MSLSDFASMHRDLLVEMGEPGTVMRGEADPVPLVIFTDDAVQDVGQYGRVIGNKRVVSVMNEAWLFARGDIVTVRGRTAKVEEILANDSIVNTVVLHG